jgi:hypothetical protein
VLLFCFPVVKTVPDSSGVGFEVSGLRFNVSGSDGYSLHGQPAEGTLNFKLQTSN